MNLMERIQKKLADENFEINTNDFEQYVITHLSKIYPSVVPIPGGSDSGLDGEIPTMAGITGAVITSSREWKGARANLQGSLNSARIHGLKVERVVAVSLANINRSKREKLNEIAEEFGVVLVEVYDRNWFANEAYWHPETRRKILRIERNLSALVDSSGRRGRKHPELPTVGRDDLMKTLNDLNDDLVLFGVPGAGKTHVAGELEDSYFLNEIYDANLLLDDLLEATPKYVVVDDAGARSRDIEALLQLRAQERLRFQIVTTCWPHEKDKVKNCFDKNIEVVEVTRLTVDEMGLILRPCGINRAVVLQRILDLSDGRPAWALNLVDLLTEKDDWETVWTGQASREVIDTFLQDSSITPSGQKLLGLLSLLGDFDNYDFQKLAQLLGMTEIDLEKQVRGLAKSGLLDAERSLQSSNNWEDLQEVISFNVRPEPIAMNFAMFEYFSDETIWPGVNRIKELFPDHVLQIAKAQVFSQAMGTTVRSPIKKSDIEVAFENLHDNKNFLVNYANLGKREFSVFCEIMKEKLGELDEAKSANEKVIFLDLLSNVCAVPLRTNPGLKYSKFLSLIGSQQIRESDAESIIREFVSAVRVPIPGDSPDGDQLLILAKTVSRCTREDLDDETWAMFAGEILKPYFDSCFMTPDKYRQVEIRTYTWGPKEMEQIYKNFAPCLDVRLKKLCPLLQLSFLKILNEWVQVSCANRVSYGGKASKEQSKVAEKVARDLAEKIAPCIRSSAVRKTYNNAVEMLGIVLDEPDQLFSALTSFNWKQSSYEENVTLCEEQINLAITPYFSNPPEGLMSRIEQLNSELQLYKGMNLGIGFIFRALAKNKKLDHKEWFLSALEFGFGKQAASLLEESVKNDNVSRSEVQRFLDITGSREGAIISVLSFSENPVLVYFVVGEMTASDVEILEAVDVRNMTSLAREALLKSKVPEIRAATAAMSVFSMEFHNSPKPLSDDLREALLVYIPSANSSVRYEHSLALKFLAKNEPVILVKVFARFVRVTDLPVSAQLDLWREAFQAANPALRTLLWEETRNSPATVDYFWAIGSGDVRWLSEEVQRVSFAPTVRELLLSHELQICQTFSIEDLAKILRPLDPSPYDLLSYCELGVHTGERSDVIQSILSELDRMAKSDDEYLSNIGRVGVKFYEKQLQEAFLAEREAAIRGNYQR